MMRLIGPALRARSGDPLWSYVRLLLQDGVGDDLSSYGTSVIAGTGAVVESTEWTYNGLKTFKLIGTDQSSSIRFGIPDLGTQDWTWEIAWRCTAANSYWFADNLGNNASGLRLQVGSSAGDKRIVLATNTTGTAAPNGAKGSVSTDIGPSYPLAAYLCAERVGRYIYLSANGVVIGSSDLGYAGYVIQSATSTPRFGQQVAVANSWTAYAGQCRLTLGVARYAGGNFTPPTGPFPIG